MKYTKDWNNFDWSVIQKKIAKAKELMQNQEKINKSDIDIGITSKEFIEYFDWLYNHDPVKYYKVIFYLRLRELGTTHDEAEFYLNHPEILKQALDS